MRQVWEEGSHCHTVLLKKLEPSGDIGLLDIEITSDPLQPRIRLYNQNERIILQEALNEWLEKGIVEPSRAWIKCNPLFVAKKNGKIRTCIDYRPINLVTTGWDWPLPKIKEIRHHIRGNIWFTRLDLKDAFFHISVDEKSKPLTAFSTP